MDFEGVYRKCTIPQQRIISNLLLFIHLTSPTNIYQSTLREEIRFLTVIH